MIRNKVFLLVLLVGLFPKSSLFAYSGINSNSSNTINSLKKFGVPVATDLYMMGGMKARLTLEVFYTYTDPDLEPELGTTFQWYTYDDQFGTNKQPIAGATSKTYTLRNADAGKHISVEVTPRDNSGEIGATVEFRPWDALNDNIVLINTANCGNASGSGAPLPANDLTLETNLCSARDATWEVSYTGINYSLAFSPVIFIDWGDGLIERIDASIANSIPPSTFQEKINLVKLSGQRWQVTAPHIYDYDGASAAPIDGSCTYPLTAYFGLKNNNTNGTQSECRNADQTQAATVWDDIGNNDLGTHDVNHDATSAGIENGETVELCEGDNGAVRLIDVSTFNCTPPIETLNTNDQARWVQWVYGAAGTNITTGANADEKIIIDGVSYDFSDLPIYGMPEYLPAAVTVPNSTTLDIQMPTSASFPEVFIVQLRSWNTCNRFDLNVGDGNGLNPPQGVGFDNFNIYDGGTIIGPGVPPATDPTYANDVPIVRPFTIEIVDQPVAADPMPKEFCEGTNLNTNPTEYFEVDIPGAFIDVLWYQDNSGAPGALITTNNSETLQPSLAGVNGSSTGVNTVWVQYSANNGTQVCTSDFTATTITIRDDLTNPGIISSSETFPICADAPNFTFEVPDDPNDPPVTYGGDWEYQWSFEAGLGDDLNFIGSRNGKSVTVEITSNSAAGNRRVRVRKRFINTDDNNNRCNSDFTILDFFIDPVSQGGNASTGSTICSGDETGPISLINEEGGIVRWERSIDGGGFIPVPGSFNLNPLPSQTINIAGFVTETHTYRAVVQSGTCSSATSTTSIFTVDPVPGQPSIDEGPGPITECTGTIVTLNATADAAANSYQWFINGAPIGGATGPSYVVANPMDDVAYTYTVQAIGSNTSCTSPISTGVDVTIFSLPEASVVGGGSVCSGLPAPDIVWTLTGVGPFDFEISTPSGTINENNYGSNTYTLSGQTAGGNYEMTLLTDANGCDAIVLGGAAVVTIGGTAPSVDAFTVQTAACENNGTPTVPIAFLDLDLTGNYDIDYEVNGTPYTLSNVPSDGSGVINIQLDYATQMGSTPGTYTIEVVGIELLSTSCIGSLPMNTVDVVVNPDPMDPTGATGATVCSTDIATTSISVTNPGGSVTIDWYANSTGGVPLLSGNNVFTPGAAGTYYAESRNTTTTCVSANRLAVTLSSDLIPSAPNAGTPQAVCPDQTTNLFAEAVLNAVPVDAGGEGTWSGPVGVSFDDENDPTATATFVTPLIPAENDVANVVTLTWTVNSAGALCPPQAATVNITIQSLPKAEDPTPELCEDLYNTDNVDNVNLRVYEDAITEVPGPFPAPPPSRTIQYYTDPGRTSLILDPTDVDNISDGTVIYTRVIDSGNSCPKDGTLTFTVNQLPLANTLNEDVCADVVGVTEATVNLTTYNNSVTGGAGGVTVEWYEDPGFTTPANELAAQVDNVSNNVYYPLVRDNTTLCENLEAAVNFTVLDRPNPNPIIGANIVCSGSTPEFYQVTAGPAGTQYNWVYPSVGTPVIGGNEGGGNGEFFLIWDFGTVGADVSTDIRVTITSASGCIGVQEIIPVDIVAAPGAPMIMPITPSVCEGDLVTYSVPFISGTTYTWDVPTNSIIIGGQGTNAIDVIWGDTSGQVEVVPVASGGCDGGTGSQPVTVNLLPVLDPVVVTPVCSGDNLGIVFSGTGASSYNITASAPGLTPGGPGIPSTGLALPADAIEDDNFINTSSSPLSVTYNVTPVSSDGCEGVQETIIINILPQPFLSGSLSEIACSDAISNIEISVGAGSVAATKFNYTAINTNGLTGAIGNAQIPSTIPLPSGAPFDYIKNDSYENTTAAPVVVEYTVVPISADDCFGDPLIVNLTVNPEPLGMDDTQTICSATSPDYDLVANIQNGVTTGTDYTWTPVANPDITGAIGGMGGTINEVLTNNSFTDQLQRYNVIATSADGCTSNQYFIDITVEPTPDVTSAASQTICDGEALNYIPTGNVIPTTFSWVSSASAGIDPGSVTAASAGNITDTPDNTGDNIETVTYTITPQAGTENCAGTPFDFVVTVDPTPIMSINNINGNICDDAAVDITLNTPTQNGVITVVSVNYGAVTGSVNYTGGETFTDGQQITETLDNPSNSPVTVTYNFRVGANSCADVTGFSTQVIVDPTPVMTAVLNPAVADACNGGVLNFDLTTPSSSTLPGDVRWDVTVTQTSGGGTVAGTLFANLTDQAFAAGLANLNGTLTNDGSDPATVEFVFTPKILSLGCPGTPLAPIAVDVEPTPTLNATLNTPSTICDDDNIAVVDGYVDISVSSTSTSNRALSYAVTVSSSTGDLNDIDGEESVVGSGFNYANNITTDLKNNTDQFIDVTFTITPETFGCISGSSQDIIVSLEPTPRLTPTLNSLATICDGGLVDISIASNSTSTNILNLRYSVQVISSTGDLNDISGEEGVDGLTSQPYPGNVVTNLSNNTNSNIDVTFRFTPNLIGCDDGTPVDIVVTLEPTPSLTATLIDPVAPTTTICNNDQVEIEVTNNSTSSVVGALTYGVTVISSTGDLNDIGGEEVVHNTSGNDYADNIQVANLVNNTNTFIDVTFRVIPELAGCTSGPTQDVIVRLEPVPSLDATLNSPITICSGDAFDISIANTSSTNGTSTYGVSVTSSTGNLADISGVSGIDGLTGQNYFLDVTGNLTNNTFAPIDVTFSFIPELGACPTGTPDDIVITLEPTPDVTSPLAETICDGATLAYTPTGNVAGTTFNWVSFASAGIDGGSITASGSGPITDTPDNTGNAIETVTYTITPEAGTQNCTGAPVAYVVTIDPTPIMSISNVLGTICDDGAVDITLNTPTENGIITLTSIDYDGGSGNGGLIPGTTTFTDGQTITENIDNPTNANITVTYNFSVAANSCTDVTGFSTQVIVEPTPTMTAVLNPAVTTVCNGDNINFDLATPSTSSIADDIKWDVTVTQTGGTGTVAGTIFADLTDQDFVAAAANLSGTLTNDGNDPATVDFVFTPKVLTTGCPGTPLAPITVTVEPVPQANTLVLTTPSTICTDEAVNIEVTSPTNPTVPGDLSYSWITSTDPNLVVTPASGTGNFGSDDIDVILTNTGITAITVTFTVTPLYGTCPDGPTQTMDVIVNPEPVGFDDIGDPANAVCSKEALSYNIQNRNINNTGSGGNALLSTFTYTVSSSNEPQVPTAGLDRTIKSTDPITDVFENKTTIDVTITYTITPFDFVTDCEGDPFDVQFIIHPEPVGSTDAEIVCSDQAINYDINLLNITNGIASDFTYTVSSDNGLVNPEPNRTIKSSAPISFTYTNISGTDANITYTITPISQAENCTGEPFDVVFTVQVEPSGANYSETNCAGVTLNHDLNAVNITNGNGILSDFTYVVTSSDNLAVPPGPDRTVANDAPITDSYNNSSTGPVTITYTVIPFDQITGCEGDQFLAQFVIEPGPEGVSDTEESCSNIPLNYDIQSDNIDNGGNGVPGKFTYTVISSNPGAVAPEPARTTASTLPINFNYVNTSGSDVTITYTISPEGFGAGCTGTDFDVDFIIHPEPVVTFTTVTPTPADTEIICSGDAIPTIANVDIASSNIDWEVINITGASVTGITTGETGSGNTLPQIITNTQSADAVITVRFTATSPAPESCIGQPLDLTLIVNPEPVMDPALTTIACSRDDIGLALNTNGTSIGASTYRLLNVNFGGLTADPGNASINQTGDASLISGDEYLNTGTGPATVTYEVEPTSAEGCVGDPLIFDITINPEPLVIATPPTFCSDVPSGLFIDFDNLTFVDNVDQFQLTGIIVPPQLVAGGSNAALGTFGNGNFLGSDVYTNTADAPVQVTYTVIGITADGCSGQPTDIIVTVDPAPALSDNLNTTICSDSPTNVTLAVKTITPAATYNITIPNPGSFPAGFTAAGGNAGSGNYPNTDAIALDEYTNDTDNPVTVIYQVQPVSGFPCAGPVTDVQVTVEPKTKLAVVQNDVDLCSNDVTNIELRSPTNPTAGSITFTVAATDNGSPGEVFGYAPLLSFLPNTDPYIIQDQLVNLSNSPKTVTYTITANAAGASNGTGCDSDDEVVNVVIQPTPLLNPVVGGTPTFSQSACSGIQAAGITLESPTTFSSEVVVFEITNITAPSGYTGDYTLNQVFAKDAIFAPTITNVNNPNLFPQPVVYELTPRSSDGLCVGTSINLSFTANPTPSATITGDATICKGGFATIQFSFAGRLPFELTYNDGTSDITVNNLGPVHFITVQPETTTTYTLIGVRDANGCEITGIGDQVTVIVEDAVADPSIDGVDNGCSPLEVTFRNNAVSPGITYEWNWGDGTPSTITSDEVVTHEFNNASTFTNLTYNVTLFATNDAQGCIDTDILTVEVFPSILPNILPSTLEGCGPLTVSFLNNTLGASEHRWFYREKGTTEEREVATTPLVTYELPNTTASTIVYEVVYVASKGDCSETVVTEVTVYPELTPTFTINPNELEVNPDDGTATVQIINNTPNKDAWDHQWDFGDGTTSSEVDPGSHTYATYGNYTVTLRLLFDGGVCEATGEELVIVQPIFPVVDFEADILEGCVPTTVNFTNLSVATDPNSFSWEIINISSGGATVGVSNQEDFSFTFNQPGTYSVTLTGSNPLGITDTETKDNYIVINENPVASFTSRPSIVYLPDGTLFTQNLSTGADKFFWDFNANDPNDAGQANGEEDLVSELREPETQFVYRGFKDILLVAENTGTGCTDSLLVEQAVFVDQGGETRVPNAFSPNPNGPGTGGSGGNGNGGFNDTFSPFVQGVSPDPGSFHMQIFDRWGNLVFESWDQNVGWDGYDKNGKLMPMGVYVYRLDLRFIDGNTSIRIGDVTLVR